MAHALMESGDEGAAESLAYAVTFGELEGGEFSWSSISWIERNG